MPAEANSSNTPERLMHFVFGFASPVLIETAIRHRVFDILNKAPMGLEDICTKTETSQRGMRSMLNALVGLEILAKDNDGRYELTLESLAFLVSTKPGFCGGFFLLTCGPMLSGWKEMYEIMRTGRPAAQVNQEGAGVPFFLQFVENIFPIHYPGAQAVAEATQPFSVLDLAAGSGVWSAAIVQKSPHTRATAVDWGGVISVTRKVISRDGISDRYIFVEGGLLEADFGSGHAIATLGHIVHSEGEERSRALLHKTFNALAPDGTIVIAELLVDPDRIAAVPALIFSVNMLVNSEHGDTFSFDEISEWLVDAGFENIRTINAPCLAPLIILATRPC